MNDLFNLVNIVLMVILIKIMWSGFNFDFYENE